ncbi:MULTISPECIES: hypothetical protein [Mogibacterium]|uniref:Uncharacterized protein n=2 Tax=Mogibacterium timidum TaxID=35519 RepID=X8JAL1_9FIRM|nr:MULTISPECIES: hypothetical protein [Mogibacterium]EJU21921.1 hypothetical protein HMPREF1152_1513 [Mogibacterium sp. CM50]EUC59998.1 hypothetical protein HMPREF0581_0913 [Mogibacterium timidum ATCC 33093]NWO22805.1 hypothetical protein [Mogibacterium timidum]
MKIYNIPSTTMKNDCAIHLPKKQPSPPGICFEERPAGKTYNINKLVLGRPYESD